MTAILLAMFILFHRLDGHIVWINPSSVSDVQGAGQIGFQTGTLISAGHAIVVKENVNQVIQKLRAADAAEKADKCSVPVPTTPVPPVPVPAPLPTK